ncbi:hypothetical protein GOBAR_AA28039 [Gossypium barbadense]|uniref:Uncharacterized protein n=1 Tax=Gossypium barbadense TaxID=3634 RepID=A0A2P5WNG8_GOSBA|nr:hypothetical protein GOBAR_AA28039 [Gossypium barbadense]
MSEEQTQTPGRRRSQAEGGLYKVEGEAERRKSQNPPKVQTNESPTKPAKEKPKGKSNDRTREIDASRKRTTPGGTERNEQGRRDQRRAEKPKRSTSNARRRTKTRTEEGRNHGREKKERQHKPYNPQVPNRPRARRPSAQEVGTAGPGSKEKQRPTHRTTKKRTARENGGKTERAGDEGEDKQRENRGNPKTRQPKETNRPESKSKGGRKRRAANDQGRKASGRGAKATHGHRRQKAKQKNT